MKHTSLAFAMLAMASGASATDIPDTGKTVIVSFEYALADKDHGADDTSAFDKRWAQALRTCDEHKGIVTRYQEDRLDDETSPEKTVTTYTTCNIAEDITATEDGRKHVTMAFTYDVHSNLSMGSIHAVGDRKSSYLAARDKVHDTCVAAGHSVTAMDLSHKKNALGGDTVEGTFSCIREDY